MLFSFKGNVNWVSSQIESIYEKVDSTHALINELSILLQSHYNQYLSTSDYLSCLCPECHHLLHCHGTYTRYVLIEGVKIPFKVRRVRCPVCGKTHAVLPTWLVPYGHIPLPEIIDIIKKKESIHHNQGRYRFLRMFKDLWEEFIHSNNISLDLNIHKQCLLFGRQPFMSHLRSGFHISFISSNITFIYSWIFSLYPVPIGGNKTVMIKIFKFWLDATGKKWG